MVFFLIPGKKKVTKKVTKKVAKKALKTEAGQRAEQMARDQTSKGLKDWRVSLESRPKSTRGKERFAWKAAWKLLIEAEEKFQRQCEARDRTR